MIIVTKVKYHGFSSKHGRNLCSITFNDEAEKVTFHFAFNGGYSNSMVEAQPEPTDKLTLNIVYTDEIDENKLKTVVNQLIS